MTLKCDWKASFIGRC